MRGSRAPAPPYCSYATARPIGAPRASTRAAPTCRCSTRACAHAEALGERLAGRSFALVLTQPDDPRARDGAARGPARPGGGHAGPARARLRRVRGPDDAEIREERPGWDVWTDGSPGGETLADAGARADRVIERAAGRGRRRRAVRPRPHPAHPRRSLARAAGPSRAAPGARHRGALRARLRARAPRRLALERHEPPGRVASRRWESARATTPGTFSWAELAASDAGAAKDFYTGLFGWKYDDNPIPDGSVYSIALRDGKRVGALFASEQPPHWNCYVTVASADDAAARAADARRDAAREPFDVLDAGRMAVIADPQGAALCVWEPRATIGAELVNGPGRADLVRPADARPRRRPPASTATCSAGRRSRCRAPAATA